MKERKEQKIKRKRKYERGKGGKIIDRREEYKCLAFPALG
jgi:hypothetical protein